MRSSTPRDKGLLSSGRIVANPDITQFWDHFRLDGDKAGGFNSLQILHVWSAVWEDSVSGRACGFACHPKAAHAL